MNRFHLLLSFALLNISTTLSLVLPTTPSFLQLPSKNNSSSNPGLYLPPHPAYASWPTAGVPIREEYFHESPDYLELFEYFFRINRYGALHYAGREKILKGLRSIWQEIKSGPEEVGSSSKTYSHEGVVLHIVYLSEDDEERVDALMLQALVMELRKYSTSANVVKEVLKGEFGPMDGAGGLRSVATWKLEIRK